MKVSPLSLEKWRTVIFNCSFSTKILSFCTLALALIKAQAYPHFLDVMAILFVLNIIIMLVIGKLKPMKEPFVQEYTKQVDITPWKYTKQAGIAICVIVIGVYIYFA